jgi:hypothetical protein
MNQNEFFMYHLDRITRLIYADYLESQGDLFLASVLREEENVPITCEFKGEGSGDGSGWGSGYVSGSGWGDGSGYGVGVGVGSVSGYGFGDGWGSGDGHGNGGGQEKGEIPPNIEIELILAEMATQS